ncbi:PIN domain-containing protein [Deinococcus radiophilus]|uniref:PIN domain-containing protein n=1 Tax=Deinococcus radiophilus TaxID=32062 RepID=UPI00360B1CBF
MTVLDASALLTYLFGEPGTDAVQERLPGSVMHTVNLAEVLSKLAERGLSPEDAQAQLEAAGLSQVITIDPGVPEDAYTVARLRPLTRGQSGPGRPLLSGPGAAPEAAGSDDGPGLGRVGVGAGN